MAVYWKIGLCLLLPLIWGLGVEFIFEALRRRRHANAAAGEQSNASQ